MIAHQLLSPVRYMRKRGGELFEDREYLGCLAVFGRIDDLRLDEKEEAHEECQDTRKGLLKPARPAAPVGLRSCRRAVKCGQMETLPRVPTRQAAGRSSSSTDPPRNRSWGSWRECPWCSPRAASRGDPPPCCRRRRPPSGRARSTCSGR